MASPDAPELPPAEPEEAPPGDSMPSNAPVPRRGPPMQGHWADKVPFTTTSYQVQEQEDVMNPEEFSALLKEARVDSDGIFECLDWLQTEGFQFGIRTPADIVRLGDAEELANLAHPVGQLRTNLRKLHDKAYEQMQAREVAAKEENLSIASSLPSAAPEFYEEEPVTLSRVEEILAIEHGMREACRTLPITMASWIFFTLLIFYHGEVQGSYDSASTIKEAMQSIHVRAVNNSETLRDLRIGSITERYDIIQWVKLGLVPTVTVPELKHGQLRRTQQMLGKVRFSQKRGVPKECSIPKDMASFYGDDPLDPVMCHPLEGEPETFGWPAVTQLQYSFPFSPNTYGGGKSQFVVWLDIGRNISTVNDQIDSLLEGHWLDDDTHEVKIEAMFLNPELNVYSKLVIDFQLHRGGWIQQDIHVTPMRGDVHYHWAVIWMDVMWVTIMIFLLWQAILHGIDEIKKGLFAWWITDFFSWIDFFSILGGLGIAVFYWYQSTMIDEFVVRCGALGGMPKLNGIEAVMTWKTRYILWNWNYEKDVQGILDHFDSVNKLTEWHRFLALCYNLIVVCRFYRGFTGQPRIAVILQTISEVGMFLFHYIIVLMIVMANFILTGYILFGEQLRDWATLGNATCSAFLMIFGRFDYTELHSVAPVSAAVWFSSFFILVCLVITGLTTATMIHHYMAVRARTGQAGDSIVKQTKGLIEDICFGRSYDGAQKSLPPDKLFEMLTFHSDHPARIRHLSRFNIDRRMRTRHDIHEAEIDPRVDREFLEGRGMDRLAAERFLDHLAEAGHHIEMRSSPTHRLTLFIARQMSQLRFRAQHMRAKTTERVKWSSKAVDRVDLKHAKSVVLAQRLRCAQKLPPGWTQHTDEEGKRYLRQEETGLTSWTLPRHLI